VAVAEVIVSGLFTNWNSPEFKSEEFFKMEVYRFLNSHYFDKKKGKFLSKKRSDRFNMYKSKMAYVKSLPSRKSKASPRSGLQQLSFKSLIGLGTNNFNIVRNHKTEVSDIYPWMGSQTGDLDISRLSTYTKDSTYIIPNKVFKAYRKWRLGDKNLKFPLKPLMYRSIYSLERVSVPVMLDDKQVGLFSSRKEMDDYLIFVSSKNQYYKSVVSKRENQRKVQIYRNSLASSYMSESDIEKAVSEYRAKLEINHSLPKESEWY
jgi:hypothetical protein